MQSDLLSLQRLSRTDRTATTVMIRVFTVFCKLNQISFSDRQWLEKDLDGFCPDASGACPFCRAKGCLLKFACYDRYLIELKEGTPVAHEVRVHRYRCTSCGHTHAVLSSSLVPYRSYSLRFILQTLRCYFLHRKTVTALCEAAGISPSTLYEWKKLFLRQKSLWLGIPSSICRAQTGRGRPACAEPGEPSYKTGMALMCAACYALSG